MESPWLTDPANTTLAELYADAARRFPDTEAVVDGPLRITYARLWEQAGGLGEELCERGVGRGDVVAIALPSSAHYAVAYAAIARIGAVATGVNPRHGSREVAHILTTAEPRAVVCGEDMLDRLPAGARELVVPVERFGTYTARTGGEPAKVDPGDPAVIVWTSGTTGLPKGAWFDNNGLRLTSEGAIGFLQAHDRKLIPLPFVHGGFMTRSWETVASGTTLVITPVPWRAADMLDLLERERITFSQAVPTQWQKVLDLPDVHERDLSAFRLASSTTAPSTPELIHAMMEVLGCQVNIRFTSTEAGPGTTTYAGDPPDVIAHTLGRAVPGGRLQVTGPDGRALPPGEVGAVRINHGGRMRGYWRNPEETERTLSPDGWVDTGDLGHLTEEGNLVLSGRSSDLYIRGGYNVYPREVELALAEYDRVADAAVVGVESPVIGEIGVAVLVPTDPGSPPTVDDVRSFLRGRVADYKLPDEIRVVAELPRNALMKVSRPALKEVACRPAAEGERR